MKSSGRVLRSVVCVAAMLVVSGCGDFGVVDAEVEVVGSVPHITPGKPSHTVAYRVISPPEFAGKYGVDYTAKSAREVEAQRGKIYTMSPLRKWRYSLSSSRPRAAITAGGDFFEVAREKGAK